MTRVFPCPPPTEPVIPDGRGERANQTISREPERAIRAIPTTVRLLPLAALDRTVLTARTPCGERDPEDYYPPQEPQAGRSASGRRWLREQAAQLCSGCPVPSQCLERSLRGGRWQWGVAGALSAHDRKAGYDLWLSLDPDAAGAPDVEDDGAAADGENNDAAAGSGHVPHGGGGRHAAA